jgi:hypothetical protein
MESGYWILDENNTPQRVDARTWSEWFGVVSNRTVAYTQITSSVFVSTVFIGLDHQFGKGPPLLFETMIFHDDDGREQWRYSTWEDAKINHDAIVKRLRSRYCNLQQRDKVQNQNGANNEN